MGLGSAIETNRKFYRKLANSHQNQGFPAELPVGFLEMEIRSQDPTYYLWLLDVSGPAAESRNNWGQLSEACEGGQIPRFPF